MAYEGIAAGSGSPNGSGTSREQVYILGCRFCVAYVTKSGKGMIFTELN